jgi:hypothetical protein
MMIAVVETGLAAGKSCGRVLMRGDVGGKVVVKRGRAEMSERRWVSVVRRVESWVASSEEGDG